MTTENCKEVSKKRENGYKKKINGSQYLFMWGKNEKKGIENCRRGRNNRKFQGLKEKEKMDMKTSMESEVRKKNGRIQALLEKRSENKPGQSEGGMND